MKRRDFIINSLATSAGLALGFGILPEDEFSNVRKIAKECGLTDQELNAATAVAEVMSAFNIPAEEALNLKFREIGLSFVADAKNPRHYKGIGKTSFAILASEI